MECVQKEHHWKRGQSISAWCRERAEHKIGEANGDWANTWKEFKRCVVPSAQIDFISKNVWIYSLKKNGRKNDNLASEIKAHRIRVRMEER